MNIINPLKAFLLLLGLSLINCGGESSERAVALPPIPQAIVSEGYHSRPLFGNQPTPKDVMQASFNICYFYAFLSAYANIDSAKIMDNIKRISHGFSLRVFPKKNEKLNLFLKNKQFDTFYKSGKANGYFIWPEILALAWVKYLRGNRMADAVDKQIQLTGTDRLLGIKLLNEGKIINISLVMKDPFQFFLNKTGKMRRIKPKEPLHLTSNFLPGPKALFDFVADCIEQGCIMYAYVKPGPDEPGLISHHCYGVMGIDKPTESIALRNPHGGNRAKAVWYAAYGKTPIEGIQINEQFNVRSEDFYNWFYTLQFSEF